MELNIHRQVFHILFAIINSQFVLLDQKREMPNSEQKQQEWHFLHIKS